MVDGGRTTGQRRDQPPTFDIADAFRWCTIAPIGICKIERVYVAATKASPATEGRVKPPATRTPAKKAAARSANVSAPGKRATKSVGAKAASGTPASRESVT